jgi:hypothetical protein
MVLRGVGSAIWEWCFVGLGWVATEDIIFGYEELLLKE